VPDWSQYSPEKYTDIKYHRFSSAVNIFTELAASAAQIAYKNTE
jgi:hypothetical protein